jgi:hypothetical protein
MNILQKKLYLFIFPAYLPTLMWPHLHGPTYLLTIASYRLTMNQPANPKKDRMLMPQNASITSTFNIALRLS